MTAHVPEKQLQEDFSTPSTYQQISSSAATVAAYGLQFTPENLAKMPEQLLGYITQCTEHRIRQANKIEDIALRAEYRSQATLLRKLHAHLESRISCLADDAVERQRVESSHCLWD